MYLQQKQTTDMNMSAFQTTPSYLRYYADDFGKNDIELASLFKTQKFISPINYDLDGVEDLRIGPINELELGYFFRIKETGKKDSSELSRNT